MIDKNRFKLFYVGGLSRWILCVQQNCDVSPGRLDDIRRSSLDCYHEEKLSPRKSLISHPVTFFRRPENILTAHRWHSGCRTPSKVGFGAPHGNCSPEIPDPIRVNPNKLPKIYIFQLFWYLVERDARARRRRRGKGDDPRKALRWL